jgi:hypothetical protein
MSPLALQLLRRVAAGALALTLLLIVLPPLVTDLGIVGPTVGERIEAARRAVDAARSYGASTTNPELQAALSELDRARQLADRGERVQARRAAAEASARAVAAQRIALVQREQARREADRTVKEIDRRLNELEDLYGKVTAGRDKATASQALSLMKEARQVGARLFVAFEEGDFGRVLAERDATDAALMAVRDSLTSMYAAPRLSPTPNGRSARR